MPSDRAKAALPGIPPGDAPHQACLIIQSDTLAVREVLGALMSMAPLLGLSDEVRGNAEIVLAEALNNVVEHAYRDGPGPIRVCIDHLAPLLTFSVFDQGAEMPGGTLPTGRLEPLGAPEDLPEGGFGWFLIRTLTLDLRYERAGGTNHLRFALQA